LSCSPDLADLVVVGRLLTSTTIQWPLSELAYLAHLGRPGEEIVYDSEGRVDETKLGSPTKGALTRIARIKPTRDHNAGLDENGNVVDWISVWTHHDAMNKGT
jgi:hypothetical protein